MMLDLIHYWNFCTDFSVVQYIMKCTTFNLVRRFQKNLYYIIMCPNTHNSTLYQTYIICPSEISNGYK